MKNLIDFALAICQNVFVLNDTNKRNKEKNQMNKNEYKAQASQQRKQANAGDVVTRTLERNLRRDFRCLVKTPLRKLAKQIRHECEASLMPARANEDALMAM